MPTRDDLASQYLDQLLYEPYPVQEEALLQWFTSEQGILVCAPTGTGKTLIAEAALFEALHSGKTAYYTTPLIALTDQKFQEIQEAAVRWGFQPEDVGLVTGNRKVNPDAKVLVVVAEILLNRLLNREAFDFADVSSVVMDEFHSFNDRERGIVWELSLGLLPKHVRLMLLSATVGNTAEFLIWLNKSHGRRLDLVQSTDRKVPLRYHWVPDQLLNEQLELMASGDEESKKTPTLLFCFNREECWRVAEQLKGKSLLVDGQQKQLVEELDRHDWKDGIGPKLKTILMRGVGVHHAGVLPKYKRIVESLFQRKLLSVCVCTETLSAGMNLPARSVLLTTLMKGPPGKKSLIDPSIAHQIFGRAGRPQFDTEGHVFALAHEDDVRIHRFRKKLDQIPDDTKDPLLIKKKKQLKKKMPTRRKTEQYWNEDQFKRLIEAPPTNLQSQGQFPWRLLAYMLTFSPDVARLRDAVRRRLMDEKQITKAHRALTDMLLTLESAGFVTLLPRPPDSDSRVRPASLITKIQERAATGEFSHQTDDVSESAAAAETGDMEPAIDDTFGIGVVDDDLEAASPTETKPDVTDKQNGDPKLPDVNDQSEDEDVAESGSPVDQPPDNSDKSSGRLSTSLGLLLQAQGVQIDNKPAGNSSAPGLVRRGQTNSPTEDHYEPDRAYPTEKLTDVLTFKSINPLYGMFLLDVLPHADSAERVQALESVLEIPPAVVKSLRIPRSDILPPSPFTLSFLNPELLQRGIASQAEVALAPDFDDDVEFEDRVWPLTFPEKMLRLFEAVHPGSDSFRIMPAWAVGELLHFSGDFNQLITSKKLARQEGIIFRHVLRFILLCEEFVQHLDNSSFWHDELLEIADQLTESCRHVDARSTEMMIESMRVDSLVDEESLPSEAANL